MTETTNQLEALRDEDLLAGPEVEVTPEGGVAVVPDLDTAHAYARDLRRQTRKLDKILALFDSEIERLRAARDDLAAAPRAKTDLLTQALMVWHSDQLAEAKGAGIPEKKWPKSIKMPQFGMTLKSRAGSLTAATPAEDSEEYIDFVAWVDAQVPDAVTEVPASRRVNLAALKQGTEILEEAGRLVLQPDPEDPATWEVCPFVKVSRGDRSHSVVID